MCKGHQHRDEGRLLHFKRARASKGRAAVVGGAVHTKERHHGHPGHWPGGRVLEERMRLQGKLSLVLRLAGRHENPVVGSIHG